MVIFSTISELGVRAVESGDMGYPTQSEAFCPYYHRAIELIGRRWAGVILMAMMSGIDRFGELVSAIPGLSDRMLSERLKELEAEGLVERVVIPKTPVRVEYHLTEKGRALGGVTEEITRWAHDWLVLPQEPATSDIYEEAGEKPGQTSERAAELAR
jgi:DNA-binding HxlR family transcriptional regulator